MRTTKEMHSFIAGRVQYLDWSIDVKEGTDGRAYLQVFFLAGDSTNDLVLRSQAGRKWYLSPYMTDTELVRTAHKAVRAAVEHECDENFKYKGAAIFSPHTDVELLFINRVENDNPDDVRK